MAIELHVYFSRRHLASIDTWRTAASALGVRLDPTLRDLGHSGFLPVVRAGESTGFELYFDSSIDTAKIAGADLEVVASTDTVATFRLSEGAELAAAYLAAAALAAVGHGVVHDPSDGVTMMAPAALGRANEVVAELTKTAAKVERKTPARWATATSEIVTKVHADYVRNKAIKLPFVEFTRRDTSGLFLSQNFAHIRGTFYQCFALLFSTSRMGPTLYTPVVAGSRFDHDRHVSRALEQDLVIRRGDPTWPARLISSTEWRSNTMPFVEHCFQSAESLLFPHYRRLLARGAERLGRLFDTAARFFAVARLGDAERAAVLSEHPYAREVGEDRRQPVDTSKWDPFYALPTAALIEAERLGYPLRDLVKHRDGCINRKATDFATDETRLRDMPSALRDIGVVVHNAETFYAVRDELPAMIETTRRLSLLRD